MRSSPRSTAIWLLAAHFAAAIGATLLWAQQLEYDRAAVGAGELWRLVSASYVHTNVAHLALNLCAIALLMVVMPARMRIAGLIALPLLAAGVMAVEHTLLAHRWACGLSGALHGLAVLLIASRQAGWVGRVVGAVALTKAAAECWTGSVTDAASLIEAPVLVEHHLAGAVMGAVCVAAVWLLRYMLHRNSAHHAHEAPPSPHGSLDPRGVRDSA